MNATREAVPVPQTRFDVDGGVPRGWPAGRIEHEALRRALLCEIIYYRQRIADSDDRDAALDAYGPFLVRRMRLLRSLRGGVEAP